jgi:hypothetical protein
MIARPPDPAWTLRTSWVAPSPRFEPSGTRARPSCVYPAPGSWFLRCRRSRRCTLQRPASGGSLLVDVRRRGDPSKARVVRSGTGARPSSGIMALCKRRLAIVVALLSCREGSARSPEAPAAAHPRPTRRVVAQPASSRTDGGTGRAHDAGMAIERDRNLADDATRESAAGATRTTTSGRPTSSVAPSSGSPAQLHTTLTAG